MYFSGNTYLNLLCRRELSGCQDATVHLADQWHRICDALIPARRAPRLLSDLFACLQRVVAPDVMYIIQPSNLAEESCVSRVVVPRTVADRARPIVCPLYHGTRFQPIRTHLVDVAAFGAGNRLGPITEREQILQVSTAKITTALRH